MKHICSWFSSFLISLVLLSCTSLPIATPTQIALAPDFRLPTLTGETISLSDLRGRWVLINFWATWCLPCRDEMPYLQQLADQHADQLVVVGVNMRETDDVVRPFVEELGLTFPILLQPDNATLLAYDVRGLPISLLVSPQGAIVLRQVGPLEAALFDPWLLKMLQQ